MGLRKAGMMVMLALTVHCWCMAGQASYTIGVCVMGTRHPFFRDMLDELESQAGTFRILSGDADFNMERQTDILEGFIRDQVDLIMVSPFDSNAVVPTLQKARAVNIPVMTIDTAANWPYTVSTCTSDNRAGGRLAAGLLLEELEDLALDGKTILIIDHAGVTSTEQRISGFTDVMAMRGMDYRLVVKDAVGQAENARRLTSDALQEYGDDLVAVFGANDGMTLGALTAVRDAGKTDRIRIVGFDFDEDLKNAVDADEIVGFVVQFPRQIAREAMTIARNLLIGGNQNPPSVMIEVGLYTQEGYLDQRFNRLEGSGPRTVVQ